MMDSHSTIQSGVMPKPPMDLSHHYSNVTKARDASMVKKFYKYFQINGIGNLAGGLPNQRYFPYDTLEAQAAKPDRWQPTPNDPSSTASSSPSSTSRPASHIVVPKAVPESDPFRKIDLESALQYGTAEGYPPLRSFVRQFAREHLHPNVPYAGGPEVILTCGSTDGFAKSLDLLTNVWSPAVDPPDERPHILCEVFAYGNAINQASPRGLRPAPVEIDAQGMMAAGPGGLEDVLANWDVRNGRRPRLMYTVTMGHNPTSGVLSLQRRKEIYALCSKYDVIIIEDDPYWYLQYPSAALAEAKSRNLAQPRVTHGQHRSSTDKSSGYDFLDSLVPSYLNVDTDGRVIRLDTFSKTVAPGCRLGWITAQPAFIERLLRVTESTTQQPSGFVQSMVAELVMGSQPASTTSYFRSLSPAQQATFSGWSMDGWVRWLEGLRGEYERRMNRMCRILDDGSVQLKHGTPVRESDRDWGVVTKTRLMSFDWPRGGMFVWVRLHFESHPLWQAAGKKTPLFDGPVMAQALMMFMTKRPQLVLAAPGLMFAPTDEIRGERAWAFSRLCFAAEDDEKLDAASLRFAKGVHSFWKIKDVDEMDKLMDEFTHPEADALADEMGNLGVWAGC